MIEIEEISRLKEELKERDLLVKALASFLGLFLLLFFIFLVAYVVAAGNVQILRTEACKRGLAEWNTTNLGTGDNEFKWLDDVEKTPTE